MPKYEVFIPAADSSGFNMTLKVGAENWMAALKAGVQKLGEQGTTTQNVMVDIQDDDSIHVTDATTGRVFRIREISEEEAAAAPVKRSSSGSGIRRAPVAPPADTAKTIPGIPAVRAAPAPVVDTSKTLPMTPAQSLLDTQPGGPSVPEIKAAPAPAKVPVTDDGGYTQSSPSGMQRPNYRSSPRIELKDVEELERPIKPITGSIGRAKSSPTMTTRRNTLDDVLTDVFLRVTEIEKITSIEEAMNFVLDLAMENVPCDSGSVLRSNGFTGDLSFICARGPKSAEVMKSKIVLPAGTGIAGFCASEGVSLAVSDVQKHPKFYAAVAQKLDYETKSLACCPMMTHGRSFGCIQLINRKGGPQFAEHEVGLLSYLAHQASLFLNNRL